jgi:hypothetical protein
MAIKTVTVGGSTVDYDAGWKQLTIKNAKYDTYNGKKFIDIWFEDYPDNLNARVYETVNKTTKEEFRISNWFRFTNSGVQEVIDNGTGKPVITYDDDAGNLRGATVNVLFYKESTANGEFARIWREPAPTVMETEKLSYTDKDVSFWKTRSERSLVSYQSMNGQSKTSVDAISHSISEGLPADSAKAPF